MFILALEHVAEQHHQQADQEHGHGKLIDKMHGTQVEVGVLVRIILAEEITEGRTEIKQVATFHYSGFWYAIRTPKRPE